MFNFRNIYRNKNNSCTIVTALLDIGRDNLTGDFTRKFDTYIQKMLDWIHTDEPMVIFTHKHLENQILEKRKGLKTIIYHTETSDLESIFPFIQLTEKIRKNNSWKNTAQWLPKSPQSELKYYNPLVMSKFFWLNKVASENPFKTSHFYWLDAGITQTVHPGYFWHDNVLKKEELLKQDFTWVAYPYCASNEIHGFQLFALKEYAKNEKIDYVVRGGFFGGNKKLILKLYKIYHGILKDTLSNGFMGTEESIFTILSHLEKNEVCINYINEDGLISTFFEELKNENLKSIKSIKTNFEKVENNFNISTENWKNWHNDSPIHFEKTINTLKSIFIEKSQINYVDVGASTGSFFDYLSKYLTIEKALFIEPNRDALDFAKTVHKNKNIIFVQKACGDSEKLGYLNLSIGENNNLGVFSVYEFPEFPCYEIEINSLSKIIEDYKFYDIDLIKIHLPSNHFSVLKGLLGFIKNGPNLPIICFDYGYYESKDKLNELLNEFYEFGYSPINLYKKWGSDIILTPLKGKVLEKINFESNEYEVQDNGKIYTYILTYNFPKQLNLLMESFEKRGKYLLENTQLVLINNSDDIETDTEYENIANQYNMIILKKGNIGINGGRQLAAEHFEENNGKYMFFFEDDMLLQTENNLLCRNGFATILPDLFETCIEIMDLEKYDFLKLSFTEFFGDNKKQWAWHNLPQDIRQKYFPENNEENIPQLTINKIKTLRNTSYIEGDVYYCNWPQIVSKMGNKKMFLETKWQHPYEQTWMSHIYQLTRENIIKPALLLASPINHNRVFHYKKEQRKEN